MAIDPATAKAIAKAVISQITDEDKRQRLIIGIVVGIIISILLLMIPIYIITEPINAIKSFFGFDTDGKSLDENYNQIVNMKNENGYILEIQELIFNGTLPMPVRRSCYK